MKTNILILLLIVSTLSLVGAESIGTFQLSQDVEIYQTCNNCTYCNFTRVMGPSNQTIVTNISSYQDGTYFFYNIEGANFTRNGQHTYCYACGNDADTSTGCLNFDITYAGGELTQQMATIYIIAFGVLIFLFILILAVIRVLPSKDTTSEEGMIMKVSDLKHLRPVLWGVEWGLVLALLFIVSNITMAYLPRELFGRFFFVIYQVMFWISIPMLFVWVMWMFAKVYQDKEIKRLIERGVDMKSNIL